jgi:hypothetical protein
MGNYLRSWGWTLLDVFGMGAAMLLFGWLFSVPHDVADYAICLAVIAIHNGYYKKGKSNA